jgi:hypothetical protein
MNKAKNLNHVIFTKDKSELSTILKHAFEILETSPDNREKLQAMQLFKDTFGIAGIVIKC